MKIVVMGTGGVGGYFGGRLAAAGADVSFIARGAHLAAIRDSGLRIESPLGDAHLTDVGATDDPAEIGPVDLVVFATKLYDVESAGNLCKPLIGENTLVVSFLNGVDSEEALASILGDSHVAGGVAYISAEIGEPGLIRHHSQFARLVFGTMDGSASPLLEQFLQLCQTAGIDAALEADIAVPIWRKFALLASLAAVTCLTRLPIGPIRDEPASWRMAQDAIREVVAVAKAVGVDIGDDAVDATIKTMSGLPDGMKASMLFDLERGNRLEVDWLSGTVFRLARAHDLDVPVHRVAYAALRPYVDGNKVNPPANG